MACMLWPDTVTYLITVSENLNALMWWILALMQWILALMGWIRGSLNSKMIWASLGVASIPWPTLSLCSISLVLYVFQPCILAFITFVLWLRLSWMFIILFCFVFGLCFDNLSLVWFILWFDLVYGWIVLWFLLLP